MLIEFLAIMAFLNGILSACEIPTFITASVYWVLVGYYWMKKL